MKRIWFVVLITVVLLLIAIPAYADGPQGTGANASPSGATHGGFADVNGNFGWLGGLGGTPGYHGAVGQEPGATGYNNSAGAPWGSQKP